MTTRITVCEFPDESPYKAAVWERIVGSVDANRPDVLVLPEMPFCDWIFTGDAVDPQAWALAVAQHDTMIGQFRSLEARLILSSRPVEIGGRRFNESYYWSRQEGYVPIRRKWYLPDVESARETLWFDQGDREFRTADAQGLKVGVILCSEIMVTERARDLGFADTELIVHPRASGDSNRWRAAVQMSAVASGCFVVSANRRSHTRTLFGGKSWLVAPDGTFMGETSADEPCLTLDISIESARTAKGQYPHSFLRQYLRA